MILLKLVQLSRNCLVILLYPSFPRIEIVSHCLELLHFDIDVPASVYAKYYFGLRSLAGDNDRNFLSAPLSKERAQNLKVRW